MARTDDIRILWRGDSGSPPGNLSPSSFHYFLNNRISQSFAFAEALKLHTLCNYAFMKYSLVYDETTTAPGTSANVDKKATLHFRHVPTLKVYTLTYPAPIAADIEDVGWGKRIKMSAVEDIVDDLNIFAGVTFEPLYGTYKEKT